jgi:hypothetical protein
VATVVNAGLIKGGAASVRFGVTSDRLIVESGAAFTGAIAGGGGTLELAGGTQTIAGLGATGTLSGGAGGTFSNFGAYVIDAGDSLTLTGAANLAAGKALANAGTLTVAANSSLTVAGALTNSGVIDITGGAAKAYAGLVVSGTQSLTGKGTIVLNATGYIAGAAAGASLVNVDNTIRGAGLIASPLTLTNDATGAIDATNGTMGINLQGTLVNDGLIESTGTGTMFVRFTTIDSSGGGTIIDGKRLWLDTSTLKGGSLTIDAGASLKSGKGASSVFLAGGTVTNAGIIEGTAGGLTIDGPVANNHVLESFNGDLRVTGAVTGTGLARLLGKGSLEIDGAFAQRVTFVAGSTATLVLSDPSAFTGAILGFSKTGTNHIDLDNLAFSVSDVATYTPNKANPKSGGTLTITNGSTVLASLHLAGTDYTGSTFTVTNDGSGRTLITDPQTVPAVLTQAIASFQASPPSGETGTPAWVVPKLPMVHGSG